MSSSIEVLENYNKKWEKDHIYDSDFHKGIKAGYQMAIDTLKFHTEVRDEMPDIKK